MHFEKIKIEIIATVKSNKQLTPEKVANLIQEMGYDLVSGTAGVTFTDDTEIRNYELVQGTHQLLTNRNLVQTKKEFIETSHFIKYTSRGHRDKNVNVVFYGWKDGFGFNKCMYARACVCTKKELLNTMYAYVTGNMNDSDVPCYIQMKMVKTDAERFKAPLSWKW
jgi:hypothetical protein